ncbi:MAG: paraquat-inducible protein A [Cardiobacteriaceae bacterium]|nr:paraquat-inducible protein A [Cardiobacteriaceae bacterium]
MCQRHLLVCPYCDALYQRKPLRHGENAYCTNCGSKIDDGLADFRKAFIYALTALILFIIANSFPFITLSLSGDTTTISVFSSVKALFNNNLHILGVLVFMLIIIMPLWYLLAVLWVITSFRLRFLNNISQKFLHWMSHMAPWNMLEVYLIGVIVTMVKIMQIATITFQSGFWAFCALMFCSIFVTMRFDLSDAIFLAYEDDYRF